MRRPLWLLPAIAGIAASQGCPFSHAITTRDQQDAPPVNSPSEVEFLSQFELNDTDSFMTTDWGTPIAEQWSEKVGQRGPTLMEDFIYRQKLQRFNHERVPERVVHARGAGAHGVFTAYADWSNHTAASFLAAPGKETPTFCRFSTVAGFRGSFDTARDVHGFACRLYTDEGNYDIVGNSLPVFFVQDAAQFPDLIHAVKPMPNNEIPQAATAHDSAWDWFSQQSTSLHTVLWYTAGHGIPRSFRHVNGFGVNTFRWVTAEGKSWLVKYRWRSQQGVASLVWEEAQAVAGKNPDFMRQDLFNSIENGHFPEWELQVQLIDEADSLKFGFDLLDATKYLGEDIVPFTPVGKMVLNRNPTNYFAETEQIAFQPGHVVRGIDFSDDPMLQGRLYSYMDTQINRHGGPNFEQIPINRPLVPVHNNNRDGFAQGLIPTNIWAYTPNSFTGGSPKQANQTTGKGFFTTPTRDVSGTLNRNPSDTFADHWSHPRQFWNSLVPAEQQFLVDGIRFETQHVVSQTVRNNVVKQLNRIDNDLAIRVARGIGVSDPTPDPTFYHNRTFPNVGSFGTPLLNVAGLQVAFLASTANQASITQGQALAAQFASSGVGVSVIAEIFAPGVNNTYLSSDASLFDAVIVADGVQGLFNASSFTHQPAKNDPESNTPVPASTFFPAGRPLQILVDTFKYGKPVAALGSGAEVLTTADIDPSRPGVFVDKTDGETTALVKDIVGGLHIFRFLDRFTLDS